MSILSWFSLAVYAAEVVISPIPDSEPGLPVMEITKPAVSFANLPGPTPTLPASEQAPEPTPTAPPTPTRITRHARKDAFTIAVIGDSMVDTLGPEVHNLRDKLVRLYPTVSFRLLNYGVGATNIDDGVARLTRAYNYEGRSMIALDQERPDIVVIEPFSYNPFPYDEGALDHHWMKLAELVDAVRHHLPGAAVVVAATIAPNWDVFGDGAPFVNMSVEGKRKKVEEIKRYLENSIGFARSQGLPLADAYHPSLDGSGNGKLTYINSGDHIHYSDAGRELFARVLANTIVANQLLE